MFHTRYLLVHPTLSSKISSCRNEALSLFKVKARSSYSTKQNAGKRTLVDKMNGYCTSAASAAASSSSPNASYSLSRIRTVKIQQRLQSNIQNSKNASKEAAKKEVTSESSAQSKSFLQRWMAHKEIPPRGTLKWYGEMTLICTVFAITGTSTMFLVRPAMSEVLGLKGSLKDGPWSYRICSIVIMTPLYATLLVFVGTVFGRHAYFRHFAVKMFSRFGIPPELMDKSFHKTAKNFRKY